MYSGLRDHLSCDEAHAYSGLVAVTENGGPPMSCRVYSLLLGRGGRAWAVGPAAVFAGLSLVSD